SGDARSRSSGASAIRGALTGCGSRARPASTDMARAASPTDRVSTPTWSSDHASGMTPATGTRPCVPLKPTTPQYAAGRSTEPTGANLRQTLARGGERAFLVEMSPRPDSSVVGPDARETCLGELDRAHRAGADRVRRLTKAEREEVTGWHRGPRPRPRSVRTR